MDHFKDAEVELPRLPTSTQFSYYDVLISRNLILHGSFWKPCMRLIADLAFLRIAANRLVLSNSNISRSLLTEETCEKFFDTRDAVWSSAVCHVSAPLPPDYLLAGPDASREKQI